MAHFAFVVVERLSIRHIGWQSTGAGANIHQFDGHDAAWRPMAWCQLDICDLGWSARALSGHTQVVLEGSKDRGAISVCRHRQSLNVRREGRSDKRSGALRVVVFQGAIFLGRLPYSGEDDSLGKQRPVRKNDAHCHHIRAGDPTI